MAAAPSALKPAVVSVGDELILGERKNNENLRWMCATLAGWDIPARVAVTVGDDVEVIAEHVGSLVRAGYNPILVSGGMGGTHDDRTREGVAVACGLGLATHVECRAILQKNCEERHLPFTPERQRMAELPVGATLVHNPGGAPGFSLLGTIFAFPGFPRMLQPMLTAVLDGDPANGTLGLAPPVLAERQWRSEEVTLATMEGTIAGRVEKVAKELAGTNTGATIGIYPSNEKFGKQVKLVFRYRAFDAAALETFGKMVDELRSSL